MDKETTKRVNVILLFSGGYDSSCLFRHMCQHPEQYLSPNQKEHQLVIWPVYCRYGNKNEEKEVEAVNRISDALASEPHKVGIVAPFFLYLPKISGAISDGVDCSQGFFAPEYVPYRNATMVFSALSALTTDKRKYNAVYMACHASDTALKFPDCGLLFEERMQNLLSVYSSHPEGIGSFPHLFLPFKSLSKAEVATAYGLPEGIAEMVFSGYTDGKPKGIHPNFMPPLGRVCTPSGHVSTTFPIQERAGLDDAMKHKDVVIEVPATTGDEATTSLMTKEHEPLIIRKFTQYGFPLYVAMICGANLNDLDNVVHSFCKENHNLVTDNRIQSMRNVVGKLSEAIRKHYGLKVEGIAVVWYVDKMMISSLFGDFMTHTSCRIELFSLLQMSCHV